MEDIIYNEVYAILNSMDKIYIDLIDKEYLNFIKSRMIKDKEISIDYNKPLLEQGLHSETFDIIADINLTYWKKNESSKEYLINKYQENEKGDNNVWNTKSNW